ncbi:O-methyltransferase [Pseudomonas nitroreducens]|uniref:O-methyltransferase n=1 Tax=Pseudomonas nitroreducens TaxID=46680 RepID=UPI001873758D|nr:O-methyltransferase [Pseudomonas nitritireducens]
MSASFRKIDYSLRPAKYAERKMLVEVLRRLAAYQPVEDYSYIGFGSVWFSDFTLFHRALGIRDMVSIERVDSARERIEANKPFQIRVDYSDSSLALTRLDWTKRSIVWLDYDEPLVPSMLQDINTVAARCKSGSLIAVSVQCMKAPEYAEYERDSATDEHSLGAIERFIQRFGRERVPQGASDEDLTSWPYGRLVRGMFKAELERTLGARSIGNVEEFEFQLICEIEYQDDARMTTLVGLVVSGEDRQRFHSCGFDRLDFMSEAGAPIKIEMPKLTIRELRYLEQQLPSNGALNLGAIPESDARKFARMYRYFPNFAVMES